MHLFERVLLSISERRLQPFRLEAESALRRYATQYDTYLPVIEKCLSNAAYWHGTGRYHHSHAKESRYEKASGDTTVDVLSEILSAGGLRPHFDPWIQIDGRYGATVSLATARMHSRTFARAHLHKNSSLVFELGDLHYWIPTLLSFALLWFLEHPIQGVQEVVRARRKGVALSDFHVWASAIRRPNASGAVIRTKDIFRGMDVWSDIPHNHPMLLGIRASGMKTHTTPLLEKAEVRVRTIVPIKNFTHVEVPLSAVEETEARLRERNIPLPVLPIEFCDIYCSHIPLRELVYV